MNEKDANVLSTTSSGKIGKCVICNVPLDKKFDDDRTIKEHPDYFILECPKCGKLYFPKYEIVQYEERFASVHDEQSGRLETDGLGIYDDDILLCSEEDNRFFPDTKKKKNPYQQAFGEHTNITTRTYNQS